MVFTLLFHGLKGRERSIIIFPAGKQSLPIGERGLQIFNIDSQFFQRFFHLSKFRF